MGPGSGPGPPAVPNATAVDDREVLVGERLSDPPRRVEVAGQHRLDGGQAFADRPPEALGCGEAATTAHESAAQRTISVAAIPSTAWLPTVLVSR